MLVRFGIRGLSVAAILGMLVLTQPASAQYYDDDDDGGYDQGWSGRGWWQNRQQQPVRKYYQQAPNQTGLQNSGGWDNDNWSNDYYQPGYTNNGAWNNQGWSGYSGYNAGSYGQPARPAYNPSYGDIVILGAPENDLSFTLSDGSGAGSWGRSVGASGHYKCSDDREWYIEFHRGGQYGTSKYRLKPGTYRFGASNNGWELWKL